MANGYLAECTPKKEHSQIIGKLSAVSSCGFLVGPIIGGHLSEQTHGFYVISFLTAAIFLIETGGYRTVLLLLIYVFVFCVSGCFKHTQNIAKTCIADSLSKSERPKIQGYYNAFSASAFTIGPIVSGHLVEMPGGFYGVTLITATIFLCIHGGLDNRVVG